jgi:hypothetical protein
MLPLLGFSIEWGPVNEKNMKSCFCVSVMFLFAEILLFKVSLLTGEVHPLPWEPGRVAAEPGGDRSPPNAGEHYRGHPAW